MEIAPHHAHDTTTPQQPTAGQRKNHHGTKGSYYAVTPEIVLKQHLPITIDDLRQRIDKGEDIIVAPVGRT